LGTHELSIPRGLSPIDFDLYFDQMELLTQLGVIG
jgi:hypothetical protein